MSSRGRRDRVLEVSTEDTSQAPSLALAYSPTSLID